MNVKHKILNVILKFKKNKGNIPQRYMFIYD